MFQLLTQASSCLFPKQEWQFLQSSALRVHTLTFEKRWNGLEQMNAIQTTQNVSNAGRIFKQEAIIRADFLLSFSILEYLYSYCVLLFWHYFITTFSNESSNKDIPNYIAGSFDRSGILDIEYFSKNSHSQSIDARAFYLIPFNSKFSKERPHRAPMSS